MTGIIVNNKVTAKGAQPCNANTALRKTDCRGRGRRTSGPDGCVLSRGRGLMLFILMVLMFLPGMAGRAMAQTDWREPDRLPTYSGNFRLTRDVAMDTTWWVDSDRMLDLNGYTVTFSGYSGVSIQNGATLQISDQKGGGSIRFTGSGEDSHFRISNGTLILENGIIEGKIELEPGQLFMDAEAKVTMYGGEILGSVILSKSKGAYSRENSSEMVMMGGTITCSLDSCVSMDYEKAVFNLKNGTIRANGAFYTIKILSGTFRQSCFPAFPRFVGHMSPPDIFPLRKNMI